MLAIAALLAVHAGLAGKLNFICIFMPLTVFHRDWFDFSYVFTQMELFPRIKASPEFTNNEDWKHLKFELYQIIVKLNSLFWHPNDFFLWYNSIDRYSSCVSSSEKSSKKCTNIGSFDEIGTCFVFEIS